MASFEKWAACEIERLNAVAAEALTEADTLKKTLERFRADAAKKSKELIATIPGLPLGAPEKGDKTKFGMEAIKGAGATGIAMDDLYNLFVAEFGSSYKRSNLRAFLFHQKKLGKIRALGDGRYGVPPSVGAWPSATTPGGQPAWRQQPSN